MSLTTKLLLSVVFSLFLASCVLMGVRGVLRISLDAYLVKSDFVENHVESNMSDFKKYVTDNQIEMTDSKSINKWLKKQPDIVLRIYHENEMIYDSNGRFGKGPKPDQGNPSSKRTSGPVKNFYEVKFADGNGQVDMIGFFQRKYFDLINLIGLVASVFTFLGIMLFLLRKWIKYINQLAEEVSIMEGGNLGSPITVRGDDEITVLANSIEEMRKSFIERLNNEKLARQSNSDLITAMSHDLRTPLTTQIGYLDIIEYKKYKSEDQLKEYIHKCREKAYQIKNLSDKLFEYFLAFGQEEESMEEIPMEVCSGNDVLDQLVLEHLLLLQEKGFLTEFYREEEPYFIKINIESMCRVFDNIFSNLLKYANAKEPILIVLKKAEDQQIKISFRNSISREQDMVESTGIGLKNVKRMMEEQLGSLLVIKTDHIFKVTIVVPLCKEEPS